jgi:hypothetical protein
MASIAVAHSFFWETLWNLSENADLKNLRKDPYVLLPGDRVFIPDLRLKDVSCATDKTHKFTKKGVPEHLHIVLTDDQDQPIANQKYVLVVDDELRFEGQTDGNGAIEQSIPPTARQGHLAVGEGEDQREYYIGLGHVDPVEEISGAQGRLSNLGYYDGPMDGKMNPQTVSALLTFQQKYKLSPSGENDAATQVKLKAIFGC